MFSKYSILKLSFPNIHFDNNIKATLLVRHHGTYTQFQNCNFYTATEYTQGCSDGLFFGFTFRMPAKGRHKYHMQANMLKYSTTRWQHKAK